jgi:heterodisulfide reductase subunit C
MPFIHVPIDILKQEKLEKYLPFCFKCSNCQLCPVTQFSEGYDPLNSYVYDMISSPDPSTNPNLWKCAACHYCEVVCPYGISPEKIIQAYKEKAYLEDKAPKDVSDLVNQVKTTGRGFVVTQRTHRLRKIYGLPPLTDTQKSEIHSLAKRIRISSSSEVEGNE